MCVCVSKDIGEVPTVDTQGRERMSVAMLLKQKDDCPTGGLVHTKEENREKTVTHT